MATFYDFSANSLQGEEISMKSFEGKTILIVNTASECGLTPQYEGLEALYQKYKDQGFVVLGFPCNQFGKQEPGDAKAISEGCLINYGVSFPMFEKIDVNGDNAHPLFKFLRAEQPKDEPNEKGDGLAAKTTAMRTVFDETDIIWNFGKFLINKEGKVISRFSPMLTPQEVEPKLEAVL